MLRPSRCLVLAAVLLGGLGRVAAAQPVCETAGSAAEQLHGIPSGLLNAIGRIESGRFDAASGRRAAWPWAINAEGKGRLFESRDEALAGTRALQSGGVASIDVGCFQVNLVHHRGAFATLEDGFDPARNADYAARFLVGLKEKTGSWEQAVAHYHSATPERGGPYRDRVMADWQPGVAATAASSVASTAAPMARAPGPLVIRMVSWAPAPGGMRVWTPSAAGQGAAVVAMPGRPPRS